MNRKKIAERNSRRAKKGKLEVIDRVCSYCKHHKAFVTINKIKCTRCGEKA